MNFRLPRAITEAHQGRGYWCNACPKCMFVFAGLSAFLPKQTVLKIFGKNLYADPKLLPIWKELLGLERFKPFECVGTPDEVIVAMHRAEKTGAYGGEAAIEFFAREIPHTRPFEEVERYVFSQRDFGTMPGEFASKFSFNSADLFFSSDRRGGDLGEGTGI